MRELGRTGEREPLASGPSAAWVPRQCGEHGLASGMGQAARLRFGAALPSSAISFNAAFALGDFVRPLISSRMAFVVTPISAAMESKSQPDLTSALMRAVQFMDANLQYSVIRRQQHSVTGFCDHPAMETVGSRVKAERVHQKISRKELSARTGIGYSTIAELENGGMKGSTKLHLIADVLGVHARWFETGKPPKYRKDSTPFLRPISVWNDPGDLPPESTVLLPKLDYYLSAGNGGPDPNAVERTDKSLPFSASWAKAQGWSPKTHYTMMAKGESMEPTIQDGAPVVIDTSSKGIRSGKVYAILVDGDPLLKRLVKLPGGRVQVQSDNPAKEYAPYEVAERDLEVIGRAVWTPTSL